MNDKTQRIVYYAVAIAAAVAILSKKGAVTKIVSALNYKDSFKQLLINEALEIQKRLGINPNLLITQAAVESNWGRSQLTTDDNNYFGMTAGSWISKGLPVADYPTTEWVKKPIDQVAYFETPGDLISKEQAGEGLTKVKVHRFFRHYDSMEASLNDWANLISGLSMYKAAYGAARAGDITTFAAALQAAGYATDPKYAATLIDFNNQVVALA